MNKVVRYSLCGSNIQSYTTSLGSYSPSMATHPHWVTSGTQQMLHDIHVPSWPLFHLDSATKLTLQHRYNPIRSEENQLSA